MKQWLLSVLVYFNYSVYRLRAVFPTNHNITRDDCTFFSGVAPTPALAVRKEGTVSASSYIYGFSCLKSRCRSTWFKEGKLLLMCFYISTQCDISDVESPVSRSTYSCVSVFMFVYDKHSNENYVIVYSPSCCSHPEKVYFFCKTQYIPSFLKPF